MKTIDYPIIETQQYIFTVDVPQAFPDGSLSHQPSLLKDGDWVYLPASGGYARIGEHCTLKDANFFKYQKIVAHTPLSGKPLEGVPLLPEFRQKESVEKLALEHYPITNFEDEFDYRYRDGFMEGYKAHADTHKWTDEDMRKAMFAAKQLFKDNLTYSAQVEGWFLSTDIDEKIEQYLSSLSTHKRAKWFRPTLESNYIINPDLNDSYSGEWGKQPLIISQDDKRIMQGEYLDENKEVIK